MTLPASGTITYNDFNNEAGRGSGVSIDMAFIYNNTKTGQQSYAINNYYSKAWYQRNNDGNCNNGNCTNNCNCGNINCANCLINGTVNCSNCDTRSWFQNNCNCFSQCFNCSVCTAVSINCDCACDCVCCFPGDALVKMADGTEKRIDEIEVGDVVDGGYGYKNTVEMFHEIKIGKTPLYIINGRHRTTGEHKHWTTEGWAVVDLRTGTAPTMLLMTVDNSGNKELRRNTKLASTPTLQLKVGMKLLTTDGEEEIFSIEEDTSFSSDKFVYTLCTDGSHTHIVSGNIIVGAWVRDIDFDFDTWTPRERNNNVSSYSNFNVIADFYKSERTRKAA